MKNSQSGQTLIELAIAMSVIALIATVTSNVLDSARRGVSLVAATSELRSIFHEVRMIAIARNCNVGVKFNAHEKDWTWTVYADGDGDGIRNDDIQRGRDRQIQRAKRFEHRPAVIGVPPGDVPDPLAPGKKLRDRLPVRFGTSTICSFSRDGEATNGSIVITDAKHAVIVQISGGAGRVGVLRWNGKRWTSGV
ncbi:MAG TPA: GspH/FimT family pseudopilin [Thermoanaerobaculia bacterium]|nr:GspH/FimT family pseudopilin [Thermoanaerobaculia bacterium]